MMKLWSYKIFYILRRSLHDGAQRQLNNWIEPIGFKTQVNLYNPIKKSHVPLILINEGIATWYICGPTVYDSAHIGHACTYVRFDIIRRILANFFNINIISVMGITDIDDKIIKRSQQSKRDWKELTKYYEQEFFNEMRLLNVEQPYLTCRVTDYVPQIIQFIEKIVARNIGYIGKDGSVYFDTTLYGNYGKLQKSIIEENHGIKKSSNDFALWKASKPGEPFWESPWGPGRPGWHIECSTIASLTLGSTIDIHSGGIDLLFPHHENEEAQSCCHHQVDQWVNYWLHSGHLYLADDEKMSKSLNNTISIQEILENHSANQFRLFCLLTHYRNGVEFSYEKMHNAVTILAKLEYFLSDCRNYVSGRLSGGSVDETIVLEALKSTKDKVYGYLARDFDTTRAVFAIQDLVAIVNKMINIPEAAKNNLVHRNTTCIAAVAEYIGKTLSALGISNVQTTNVNQSQLTDVVDNFVNFRATVRNRVLELSVKDKFLLEACDDARNNLSTCGIKIKDFKNTSTWTLTKD